MRTTITIEHETVAALKASRIWTEAMELFLAEGEVTVVEIADADADE